MVLYLAAIRLKIYEVALLTLARGSMDQDLNIKAVQKLTQKGETSYVLRLNKGIVFCCVNPA